jgi:hypothetical protein
MALCYYTTRPEKPLVYIKHRARSGSWPSFSSRLACTPRPCFRISSGRGGASGEGQACIKLRTGAEGERTVNEAER